MLTSEPEVGLSWRTSHPPGTKDTDIYTMSSHSRGHGPSSPNWILAVLLLLKSTSEVTGSGPTYPWKDAATGERLTCRQCPPGSSVARHCTSAEPTLCQPCPELHYTEYWNYLNKCRYCNTICGEREVETRPCTPTHNRQCQCQPGTYLYMEFCLEHSPCPAGSGVLNPGTVDQDTQCQKCPPGTFSNSSSSTEPCQPHRNCTEEGLKVNVPGGRTHDTLCTSCRMYEANSIQEVAPDCEQAIVDFLTFHISQRQLRHMLRWSEGPGSKRQQSQRLNKSALKKLHALLARLKESHPDQNVMDILLDLLSKVHLNGVERAIRRKFLKTEQ